MISLYLIFFFILGVIVGSFLNVVIYRFSRNETLLGRSACLHCRHKLAPADLVPLASYIYLGGRCRYCRKRISLQYPLVEAATGLLFLLLSQQFFTQPAGINADILPLVFRLLAACILVVIFAFDFKYYIIPDIMVAIGFLAALAYRISDPALSVREGLLGVCIVAGLFLFLYLVSSGRWIGLGDVKLGVFLGLLLGIYGSLVMLLVAYVSGAVVGVGLIMSKRSTLKGVLPFGTFLSLATAIVMLWGPRMLDWYLQNFYI